MSFRSPLRFMLLLISSTILTGCTTQEFTQVLGQTLYNSGKYLCTQSRRCDTPESHPPDIW